MGTIWLKNFIGERVFYVSDEDLKEIPMPGFELGFHVTMKTTQVGSFIASAAYPIVRFLNRKRGPVPSHLIGVRALNVTGLAFLAAGPLLYFARVYGGGVTPEGVYDRAFRIRHNKRQLNLDRFTVCGAVCGFISLYTIGLSTVPCIATCVVLGNIYNYVLYPPGDPTATFQRDRHRSDQPETPYMGGLDYPPGFGKVLTRPEVVPGAPGPKEQLQPEPEAPADPTDEPFATANGRGECRCHSRPADDPYGDSWLRNLFKG